MPRRRAEMVLLAGILLLGFVLRAHRFQGLGLSHFDEGIYAISGLWPWTGCFESHQGFYSPPVYPLLIGLTSLVAGGPWDQSGFMVSILTGTASILVGWWLARSWFGSRAGVVAAFLFAVDGFQIEMSLSGLTDATSAAFFLLSLGLLRKAIMGGTVGAAVIAGLAVGFTWNIKYNGFLPLFLSVGWLAEKREIRSPALLVLASLVSSLFYLPWAVWFHVKHGYGSLLEHQRGYFQGIEAIPPNWRIAIHAIGSLEWLPGWLPLILFFAVVSILLAPGWRARFGLLWPAAWLLILPALYSPYVRLWLPTEGFVLVLAAIGFVRLSDCISEWVGIRKETTFALLAGAATMGALAFWFFTPHPLVNESPSVGYRSAVRELAAKYPGRKMSALARPPFFYYAAEAGLEVRRLSGAAFDPDAFEPGELLIVDHAIADSPGFLAGFENESAAHHRLVASFKIQPSRITVLDDYPPGREPAIRRSYDLQVYEIKASPRMAK